MHYQKARILCGIVKPNIADMNTKVVCGIDQFTIVFQYIGDEPIVEIGDWSRVVDSEVLDSVFEALKLEELLGVFEISKTNLPHYDTTLTIEDVPYRINVAYHSKYIYLGIVIQFSAYSWYVYQREYFSEFGEKINLSILLKKIETECSDIVSFNLTRCDLTVDYYDFPSPFGMAGFVNPDILFRAIANGNCKIVNHKEARSLELNSEYGHKGRVETFKVGSTERGSNLTLTVYDKKLEQMKNKRGAFMLQKVAHHQSVMRQESRFMGIYARQITEKLLSMDLDTEEDYICFIATMSLEKCRFYDIREGKYLNITEELLKVANNAKFGHLASPAAWDNHLRRSVQNHASGKSGLFSTLYKIRRVWSADPNADRKAMERLFEIYLKGYVPLADSGKFESVDKWLGKHGKETAKMAFNDLF